MSRSVHFGLARRVRPSLPERSPWGTVLWVRRIREPVFALRVIVKLVTRIFSYTEYPFRDPAKRGEGRRSYTGFDLRFEDGCVSENCLALEDTIKVTNSLNGGLHNLFRGLCLPECYNVELSGYRRCFYEAWDAAELLDDLLAGSVLTVQ